MERVGQHELAARGRAVVADIQLEDEVRAGRRILSPGRFAHVEVGIALNNVSNPLAMPVVRIALIIRVARGYLNSVGDRLGHGSRHRHEDLEHAV